MDKKRIKSSGSDDRNKFAGYIPALIVAAVGMILYANTFYHGFVLDDITVVSQNGFVHEGIKGIPKIVKNSYWFGFSGIPDIAYRPIPLIMFAIEWQLSPDNPHFHHLINILLYGATGFLLFFTLKRLLHKQNILVPFITSLLFIAHPIHTEVVANIKSRDEMLAFFFSLLALYFLMDHLKKATFKTLVPSLLCFFLALISKENAVTMLAVIPLVIYFFYDSSTERNVRVTASFLAVFIIYIGLRLALPEGFATERPLPIADNTLMAAPDMMSRLATAINMLGRYLILLVVPYKLVSDYSYQTIPIVNWSDLGALASLAIHLFLIVYAVRNLKKKSILSFTILFYLITFSISSNIFFLTGATMAERFLYMPSLGFCLAVTVLISRMGRKTEDRRQRASDFASTFRLPSTLLFVLLLILFAVKTISRNADWKDNLTLFSRDLQSSPKSSKLNYYYSVSLLDKVSYDSEIQGVERQVMIDSAMNAVKRAVAIGEFLEAYEELAYAYFMKGFNERAKQTYEECLHKGSRSAKFYNNYAVACINSKDYVKAIELLQKAIQINPNYSEAYNNIGSAYNSEFRYEEAVPYLQRSISLNPRMVGGYKNISRSYANLKNYDAAISNLMKAMELTPGDPDIYMFLGYSYKYKGDAPNSQLYFDKYRMMTKKEVPIPQ